MKKMVFDIESFKAEEGFEFKPKAGLNKINSCTYGRCRKWCQAKNMCIAVATMAMPATLL